MTPEQISALMSIASFVQTLSRWPFAMLFFLMVIGPWILALIIAEGYRRRFEKVVEMYESNVKLVEKYESVATDLKDVIIMNTQVTTELGEAIKTNQFCPMVRLEKKAQGVQL